MANLAVAAGVLLVGLSTVLLVIGLISYGRMKHVRFLWISVAFFGLAAQGCYVTYLLYQGRADVVAGESALPVLTVVNLGVVLALYLGVLKR